MGADNHTTTRVGNVQREEPDETPEWAVWIQRAGAGYQMPFSVDADKEIDAQVKAETCVNRVLDGVGLSYKRGGGYSVSVRRIIE